MIIYKVTNLVNGKVYIGLTIRTLKVRKLEHLNNTNNSSNNVVFHRAIHKYGEDNFKWEVIDTAETTDELKSKEICWIQYYNSFINAENSNGYNMTLGGEGTLGRKMSDGHKQKLSECHKGKIISIEQRKKLSELNKGSKHPQSILKEEDVLQIKELIIKGKTPTEIAKHFNVSKETICGIKSGRLWSGLGEDVSNIKYSSVKSSKLSEDDVKKIKLLLYDGEMNQTMIAEKFNVSKTIITYIKIGKHWKHIKIN